MDETLPLSCPNTPESTQFAEDDTDSATSMSTIDLPCHQDALYTKLPKRRTSLENDSPVTPLPKRVRTICGAAEPVSPPRAPLRGVANVSPRFSPPMLLPSPLLDNTPRRAIRLFEPETPRRNAVARLVPLLWRQHCPRDSDKFYDELAYWYHQFRLQMWSPVASMMGISWEEAEELGWRMGKTEIDQRAARSSHASRTDWGNNVAPKI
ncbi:uncharacterized protein ATNIH1004_001707 [Aspergillus tanneri]|uniref:Uncharacterized protein n=1 Tax=Aspergillus tanneri TaxID=1220188 RepID=A0A5M9N0E6_9EURO|nr:uncharacterized protein ATNIH1004_001707 [Aspergillus tanneri]KAA8652802.1 hypothetical protein ATNIH1004_001707 [Aspergillus tanneri]